MQSTLGRISVLAGFLVSSFLVAASSSRIHVQLSGMTCDGCVDNVKSTLLSNPNVESADVRLETQSALISLKEGSLLTDREVASLIQSAGYSVKKIDRGTSAAESKKK